MVIYIHVKQMSFLFKNLSVLVVRDVSIATAQVLNESEKFTQLKMFPNCTECAGIACYGSERCRLINSAEGRGKSAGDTKRHKTAM